MKNFKERLIKFLFFQGQSCICNVSVQNRILGKNASLPGEEQMLSRPGKASNVFLPACPINILQVMGTKLGTVCACHPGVHMVVSRLENDGQISDRKGRGIQSAKVQAISLTRTILWLRPCVLSGYT